jgi:hypothetical protein
LVVRHCSQNCEELDPQTIRLYLASIASVPAKHITVNVLKKEEGCCVIYEIIIAAEGDSYDVGGAEGSVATALSSNPDFTVEQSKTNDNTMLKASFVLLGVLLLFV